jgi:four helix bundle protein
MQNFRELKVWEKSQLLAVKIYQITRDFPSVEQYGIISQMRRSAVSISSNIAEGCGRFTQADLARFLDISFGSACELESLTVLSRRLDYLKPEVQTSLLADIEEVKRMLTGFIQKVKNNSPH